MRFDALLMAAATQAGGAAGSPYGPELLVNGDMSSPTGWTIPPTVEIAAGVMTADTAEEDNAAEQSVLTPATTVHAVFTIISVDVGSSCTVFCGATQGITRTAAGTYTEDLLTDSAVFQFQFAGGGVVVVDNASAKRVL